MQRRKIENQATPSSVASKKALPQVKNIIASWLHKNTPPEIKDLDQIFCLQNRGVANFNVVIDTINHGSETIHNLSLLTCAFYLMLDYGEQEKILQIVEYLLQKGVAVDGEITVKVKGEILNTWTAFSIAIWRSNVRIAQSLLQAGALLTPIVKYRVEGNLEELNYLIVAVKSQNQTETMMTFLLDASDKAGNKLRVDMRDSHGCLVLASAVARKFSPQIIARLIPENFVPSEREKITLLPLVNKHYWDAPDILQKFGIEFEPSKWIFDYIVATPFELLSASSISIFTHELIRFIKKYEKAIDTSKIFERVNALFLVLPKLDRVDSPDIRETIIFTLRLLLKYAYDINRPIESVQAPLLTHSVIWPMPEVVAVLLGQATIDVNRIDYQGVNALGYAISFFLDSQKLGGPSLERATKLLNSLINHPGIDLYSPCDNTTPIGAIVEAKNYSLLTLFLQSSQCDPNKLYIKCLHDLRNSQSYDIENSDPQSLVNVHPFVIAVQTGDVECMQIFLQCKNFHPEKIDGGYEYLFAAAIVHNKINAFKLLRSNYKDVGSSFGPEKNLSLQEFVRSFKVRKEFEKLFVEKEMAEVLQPPPKPYSPTYFPREDREDFDASVVHGKYSYYPIESAHSYLLEQGYDRNWGKIVTEKIVDRKSPEPEAKEEEINCSWLGGSLALSNEDLNIRQVEKGSRLLLLAKYDHIAQALPDGALDRLKKMRIHICAAEGQNGIKSLNCNPPIMTSFSGVPGAYQITHEIKFGFGEYRIFCATPDSNRGYQLLVPCFVALAMHNSSRERTVRALAGRPVDLSSLLPEKAANSSLKCQ